MQGMGSDVCMGSAEYEGWAWTVIYVFTRLTSGALFLYLGIICFIVISHSIISSLFLFYNGFIEI